MNKVSCKYKNIYHEMGKRTSDTEVLLDEEQETLILILQEDPYLFNTGMEVLKALGYLTPPPLTEVCYEDYKGEVDTCFVKDVYLT